MADQPRQLTAPPRSAARLLQYHDLSESIVSALDARDTYTASHSNRVAEMVLVLAAALGLGPDETTPIHIAAHLHDIGKIKASRLLYVEQEDHNLVVKQMNYLRTHPFLGFEILKREGYSEFIQESILFHHENFDGSGYPSNLSGDTIPIGARVLRICDVFAALTTRKGYRPAHDADSALDFMISDVKNFDMKILYIR